MYKLFERKARCLKALKDFPRALEAMKSAEMWMRYSTLSETKSSSFKKEIAKQVEIIDEKVIELIKNFIPGCSQRVPERFPVFHRIRNLNLKIENNWVILIDLDWNILIKNWDICHLVQEKKF